MKKPTVKTIRDKLKIMLRERRRVVATKVEFSGITEEVGPMYHLLDELISEQDDMELEPRKEREELGSQEKHLVASSNDNIDMVLGHMGRGSK